MTDTLPRIYDGAPDAPVERLLETQSPQPPARHSYRFNRDWEYLEEKMRNR